MRAGAFRLQRLALKLGLLLGLMALRVNSRAQPLKMVARQPGYGNVQVAFRLFNRAMPPGSGAPISDEDGVHLLLHFQDPRCWYMISVNRRDNRVAVRKRARGRDYVLLHSAYQVPFGRWQDVRASARNNSDGSVVLELFVDGRLLAGVTDNGAVGGAAIRAAGQVGLSGKNDDFELEGFAVSPLSDERLGLAQAVLTSPASGARLSGPVVLTAEPQKGAMLAGVEFQVDGQALGPEDVSAPYATVWNTRLGANAAHVLTVVTRDASGRRRVSPATLVIVDNDVQAAQAGDVAVQLLGNGTAMLNWRTEEPATAQVEYGRTGSYGLETASEPAPKQEHSALLSGLVPGSEYHYRLRLRDATGNVSLSPDFSLVTAPDAAASPAPVAGGGDDNPMGAAAGGPPDDARAREKFLTPASADGINDVASFGAAAREVTIFNIRGRKVFQAAGSALSWNGRDENGAIVESGVYVARIRKQDEALIYQTFAVAK